MTVDCTPIGAILQHRNCRKAGAGLTTGRLGLQRASRHENKVPNVIEIGEAENGGHVNMKPQQTLRVTLSEVRTSGFRWVLRAPDQHVLSLLNDGIDSASGGPGGGVAHHWDFRAEDAGTAGIRFDYSRPWEHAASAARSYTVSVLIA